MKKNHTKTIRFVGLMLLSLLLLSYPGQHVFAQKKDKKGKETTTTTPTEKKPKSESKIKPYKEVITEKAISDE